MIIPLSFSHGCSRFGPLPKLIPPAAGRKLTPKDVVLLISGASEYTRLGKEELRLQLEVRLPSSWGAPSIATTVLKSGRRKQKRIREDNLKEPGSERC
jgi:hypothetical protein